MLEYNEIKPGTFIVFDDKPYEVLDSHVFRKQQRKPVNQTRLRGLVTGRVIEHSFHQSEKAEEAELETRIARYIYTHRDESWFNEEHDRSKRFSLPAEIVGTKHLYLKANAIVDLLSFRGEVIGLKIPLKVDLMVKEAPPAIRGSTVQGGTKQVTLETGLTANVPLFIKEGDVVRINTETGAYAERVT